MGVSEGPNTRESGLVFAVDGKNKKSSFQTDTACASFTNTGHLYTDNLNFTSTPNFSIGFWLYFDSADATPNTFMISQGSGRRFEIIVANNTNYNLLFHNGVTIQQYQASPPLTVPLDAWTFLGMSYESSSFTYSMYKNGGALKSGSATFVPSSGRFYVGGYYGSSMISKMDNIFVYDKVLSQAEWDAIYNSGNGISFDTANKTNLLHWWSVNQNSSFIDMMGNENLTLSGTVPIAPGKVSNGGVFDYSYDLINRNNQGVYNNGVSLVNGVWEFDGVNDYIELPAGTFRPATTDFSVEMWVKRTSSDGGLFVIPQSSFAGSGEYWVSWSSNSIIVGIRGLGSSGGSSGSVLSDNTWYHIVTTISNSPKESKIYVNGVLKTTDTTWTTMVDNVNAPMAINGGSGVYGFFGGQISQVKIYNRALTAQEIKDNYNEMKYRFR